VIYKLLDSLSDKLVASAPKLEERVTTGEVEVAAMFHASVKKSVSATGKVVVAGCKVCALTPYVRGSLQQSLCRFAAVMDNLAVYPLFFSQNWTPGI
jgi:hypothetical protein